MLRPQDLVVALVRALRRDPSRWTLPSLAAASGLSLSEVHAAVKRATAAQLLGLDPLGSGDTVVLRENLLEFLLHGAKYAFPAERGPTTRGVPTAHSAPVLAQYFANPSTSPLVWPEPSGSMRGEAIAPLYRTVPRVAMSDERLYGALALFDALRTGTARDREIASGALTRMLREGAG